MIEIRHLAGMLLAAQVGTTFHHTSDGPTDPWADVIVQFVPGTGGAGGFGDPNAALGEPARMTGFPSPDTEAVTPFRAAYHSSQLVSIGVGGSLTVQFNEPVEDDPANPFGVDLLIFGNAFFVDDAGGCGAPCTGFFEGGLIEVSSDGETWFIVPGNADGGWPTNGWADLTDPQSGAAGSVASDFTLPLDPGLVLADFDGLAYEQMQGLYAGSGGGLGIDLAPIGLASISYVRISNPDGLDSPEIDAFADVRPYYAGDVTGDGRVDLADLLLVIANWGATEPTGEVAGDSNADSVVDLLDLLAVISDWGSGS